VLLPRCRDLTPQHWTPGIAFLGAVLGLWLIGRATDINLIAQAGAVGALQASLLLFLGPRIIAYLLLPVGMMTLITIALTKLSGIPATYEGIYIDTPVGLFIVAEECSGVKFLIAMVTLGTLVSFTSFDSWKRRALFMTACFIVPMALSSRLVMTTSFMAGSFSRLLWSSYWAAHSAILNASQRMRAILSRN